jgi:hypothetical protein
MERHAKTLGVLHIVYGGLVLLSISGILLFFGVSRFMAGGFHLPFHYSYIVEANVLSGLLMSFWYLYLFIGSILFAVLGILGGWGLYTGRSWARVLLLVVGIIWLIRFPFGTALGIYTLWVLLKPADTPVKV